MAASAEGSNESDPNMTPLLDVVLQLIMFFMITVNFVRVENLTDQVVLPVAQSAVPQDDSSEDWVYFNVGKDGKIIANEDLDTAAKLRAFLLRRKEEIDSLASLRGLKGEMRTIVIVSAHEEARAKDIWEILNSCEKVGFRKWKIRALTR
jgi:biopolymer transport protein ExbD